LINRGAQVSYSDPFVPRFHVGRDVFCREERVLESERLTPQRLEEADCVVIVAGHHGVDYAQVLQSARVVVDTVNATAGLEGQAHVVRVGAPLTPTRC
jgi:UDP-N-acetyl-D-glucosamine dehydrogenase